MTTISERLRETPGEFRGATALELEAADTIDALVAALEEARKRLALYAQPGVKPWEDETYAKIDAALALARGGK